MNMKRMNMKFNSKQATKLVNINPQSFFLSRVKFYLLRPLLILTYPLSDDCPHSTFCFLLQGQQHTAVLRLPCSHTSLLLVIESIMHKTSLPVTAQDLIVISDMDDIKQ